MNILQYREHFRETLIPKFKSVEVDFMFKSIINSFFEFEPTVMALSPSKNLSKGQISKLNNSLL